eukprot:TRINITY_DN11228_c0_g1_i1.p1 TRINITY_DN11228_c0_g1~~TRINITY_DN11228_c0_g1_i1.p1  ORF type:complete len:860 (-),score=80.19 TRINITY_DN11228_c0_g1_i1:209-2788(-)
MGCGAAKNVSDAQCVAIRDTGYQRREAGFRADAATEGYDERHVTTGSDTAGVVDCHEDETDQHVEICRQDLAVPDSSQLLDIVEGSASECADTAETSLPPERTCHDCPKYWRAAGANQPGSIFLESHATEFGLQFVQELLDATFFEKRTRDRPARSALGRRLEAVVVLRLENSELWARYALRRAAIRSKRCRASDSLVTPVRTAASLPAVVANGLDDQVNEFLLFHGTTVPATRMIQQEGFRVDLAGTHRGTMFGAGVYFAEAASKADEYTSNDDEELHVMLLCRVCCGCYLQTTDGDGHLDRHLDRSRYDSVLGDREAIVGTYREFVIYDGDQSYPEYLVVYRRSHAQQRSTLTPMLVSTRELGHGGSRAPDTLLVDTRGTGFFDHVISLSASIRAVLSAVNAFSGMALKIGGKSDAKLPNVILVDTTDDGVHDTRLVSGCNDSNVWVPVPSEAELALAIMLGDLEAVKSLASSEVDLENMLLHGLTPMDIAIAHEQLEIKHYLSRIIEHRTISSWRASLMQLQSLLNSVCGDRIQKFVIDTFAGLNCTILDVERERRIICQGSFCFLRHELRFWPKGEDVSANGFSISFESIREVAKLDVLVEEFILLGLSDDSGWPTEVDTAVRMIGPDNTKSVVHFRGTGSNLNDDLHSEGMYILVDSEARRDQLLELVGFLVSYIESCSKSCREKSSFSKLHEAKKDSGAPVVGWNDIVSEEWHALLAEVGAACEYTRGFKDPSVCRIGRADGEATRLEVDGRSDVSDTGSTHDWDSLLPGLEPEDFMVKDLDVLLPSARAATKRVTLPRDGYPLRQGKIISSMLAECDDRGTIGATDCAGQELDWEGDVLRFESESDIDLPGL